MIRKSMGRRNFLKVTAGSAALGIAGCQTIQKSSIAAASATRRFRANERIRVGIVGMGVRGKQHAHSLANLSKRANVELAAICELWRVFREQSVKEFSKKPGSALQAFARYEEMLEKGGVDAVVITTPDFWHVPILVDSIKAGKDVYVEKPLGVTLKDAQIARDLVHASKAVVQVGTQRRSDDKFYAARDFVRSGQLGDVSTIECAFNDCSPRWRREQLCTQIKEKDIDWKYYLRDREYRPFNPRHIMEWKLFRDFTMGTSGLLACHMYDAIHLVMDVEYPVSAVSQGGVYVYKDGREVEDTFMTLLEYPQEFIVHHTTRLGNSAGTGIRIRGVRGTLDVERGFYNGEGGKRNDCLPKESTKVPMPEKKRPNHMENFIECMRTRKTPVASIDIGYQHMIASVIAQDAMIKQRRLEYDPKRDRIV